jgi:hypothetical protein
MRDLQQSGAIIEDHKLNSSLKSKKELGFFIIWNTEIYKICNLLDLLP